MKLHLIPKEGDVVQEIVPLVFNNEPGCVLLSQPGEHDHFVNKAAVFVFEHGEKGTQGVILGRSSAFSMGETVGGMGVFAPNTVYIGGEQGPDMAIMFHKYELDGYSKYVGGGIYVGGLKQAREKVERREAVPRDFKFIFNNVQWGPGQLEVEIAQKRWDVIRMPPDMLLQQKAAHEIWSKARNALRSRQALLLDDDGDEDQFSLN